MISLELARTDGWAQAQAGQPGAIALLIAAALANPAVRVEVSRRDRTLYVFLTAPPGTLAEGYPDQICALVSTLAPPGITRLKVLDGTDRPLPHRWQYDFDLARREAPPSWGDRALAFGGRGQGAAIAALALAGLGLAAGFSQWHQDSPPPGATAAIAARAAATATTPLQPLLADGGGHLVPPPPAPPVALTLKAVGDIIPGTDYQRYRLPDDWRYLFGSIQYHLGDADITFGNFESTLTEVPHSAKATGSANTFAFRTPPWYASVLKEAGFDVLSVANNHSMDFFAQGFADTIAHIEAAGMRAVGRRDDILYLEAQGHTVAFVAFSNYADHNRVQDLDRAIALVQTAAQQADIVVVSFHAGKEGTDAIYTRNQEEYFFSEHRGNVVQFSRTVVDHGADLVLGHGPHVPRAMELYNGKLIAYSLGNFLGYRSLSTVGPLGTSLILQADLSAAGDLVGGRIIPVALDGNGVPYLDDHFGGVVLVRQFTQRDFPDTPLAIDDLGYLWPR